LKTIVTTSVQKHYETLVGQCRKGNAKKGVHSYQHGATVKLMHFIF